MFLLPDELFVSEAYLQILRRPADPVGYIGYTRALRAGLSRRKLVEELQNSAEAQALGPQGAPSPGTRVAADLWPAARPARKSGLPRSGVAELVALKGPPFVDAACARLLDREPTDQESRDWSALSDHLEGRRELLRMIREKAARRFFWSRRRTADKSPSGPTIGGVPPAPTLSSQAKPPGIEAAGKTSVEPELRGTGVFTIATCGYLPFVRVLMKSLSQVHPEFHRVLLLVDEPAEPIIENGWTTVLARDLGISNFTDMACRYDVTELCTALKPYFFRWLLNNTQLQALVYVDPDVRFFSPMEGLRLALDAGAPLVLTPHITAPLANGGDPNDHTVLKSGIFNLGFAAFQRGEQATAFLDWWAGKLSTGALVDFEHNLFTDQRWCDFAPVFVPGLAVLRDKTCNVAYWNLSQRRVHRGAGGAWLVDGAPLEFFHFSGFDPRSPQVVSKYQNRILWDQIEAAQRLFLDYAEELMAHGWAQSRGLRYAYDSIDDVGLSPTLRRLYRERHPSPSTLTRQQVLQMLLEACAPDPTQTQRRTAGLPGLMTFVHAMRPDLVHAFDLSTARGRDEYQGWFWSTGVVEHGLVGLLRRARDLAHCLPTPSLQPAAST